MFHCSLVSHPFVILQSLLVIFLLTIILLNYHCLYTSFSLHPDCEGLKGEDWGGLYRISEKAMAPHSSTLAWKIPRTGGAAVHGVADGLTQLSDFTFHFHALEKEMATHSSVLAWRIPGTGGAWWAAVYGVAQNWTRLK